MAQPAYDHEQEETPREELHRLVDVLPRSEYYTARRFLEYLTHEEPRFYGFDDAPYDDEPLTAEEKASIEEARAEIARGETVSHEEVMREFGP